MKSDYFLTHIKLLQNRFGEKALNKSFVDLVWREVCTMSDFGFARTCEVFIGSRPHTKPPLLTDFREARLRDEKREFDNQVRDAASAMDWPARGGLQRFLTATYGSECKTLNQAVEMQIELNRMERLKNGEPA